MMEKSILSIIVSYNFEPWLDRCLSSLRNSTVPTQVLVVDNASSDDTVARIKSEYPEVKLIENSANMGFGKANNMAFDEAITMGYDFVFLINQDAWVEPDCLEKMLGVFDERAGIISPMHYDGGGTKLDRGFATYLSKSSEKARYGTVPFVNAAFWLVPLQVLKSVGYFSPIFYHYGEDVDFANRVIFHGLEIRIASKAVAYHDRHLRQPSTEKYFHSEFVYLLTEYCNVKYGPLKSVAMSLGACLKKSLTSLLSGNLSYARQYMVLFVRLLRKSSEAAQTRGRNRKLLATL